MAKRPKSGVALPELKTASRDLLTLEARAIAWMLVRLCCIALLSALVLHNFPALQPFRVGFDALGGVLILAPLFTALGRTFAWRIALGKAYLDAGRHADCLEVLSVLSGLRARLFDVNGEGRYYRATALNKLGRTTDADLLLTEIEEQGRDPWQTTAATELANRRASNSSGGKRSAVTS